MATTLNLQGLRALLQNHLTAALDELFGSLHKTFTEYEQEIHRQRKLLDLLTEKQAPNWAERSAPSLDLLTEKQAPNWAERSAPSPAERVQSDHGSKQGAEGRAVCTLTVKTEEQVQDRPLVQELFHIQVHSPVQTQNKTPVPKRNQVQSQDLTTAHGKVQDPQQDSVKEEASPQNEMEVDSDLVLDGHPLAALVLVPDSEDPREPRDRGLDEDPATTQNTTSEIASSSKTSHFWSNEETAFMIAKLKEFEIIKCMDGRKNRNGKIFNRVSSAFAKAGFTRTAEQIRQRWKTVKRAYYEVQRLNERSGRRGESCPNMELLAELLSTRPTAAGEANAAAAAPDVNELHQFGPVSDDEAGDSSPTQLSVLQTRDTTAPNISAVKELPSSSQPSRRKRPPPSSAAALDTYLERLDSQQKKNAERHRENLALREKTHRENKQLLQDLVETNRVLVDSVMGMLRQLPSTAELNPERQEDIPS